MTSPTTYGRLGHDHSIYRPQHSAGLGLPEVRARLCTVGLHLCAVRECHAASVWHRHAGLADVTEPNVRGHSMTLTRQDIDALVEAMPKGGYNNEAVVLARGGPDESLMATKDIRRLCYLAAGLNADGSEKPVRAIAILYSEYTNEKLGRSVHGTWDGTTFTPDGGK